MANTVIQLKHSTLTGNVPSSLANGEISINNRDGKFFYSTPAGVVVTHYPYPGPAGLNGEIQFNDSGVLGSDSGLTYNKTTDALTVAGQLLGSTLKSTQSSGDEGGQLDLSTAATNQSLVGGSVAIDIYQNRLRIFEAGGTNRGVYIDMANGATAGVGTDLLSPSSSTDGWARGQANAAFIQANTPSHVANSAASYANSGFAVANSGASYANSGFAVANSGSIYANSGFSLANTANTTANSAQLYANSAFLAANNSAGVNLTQNTNITNAGTYANSAFTRANNSINANTGGTISANLVIAGANLVVANGATEVFNVRSWSTSGLTATSNSTGTVTITGGVGVKGSIYADAIYDGGVEIITFANNAYNQANTANTRAFNSVLKAGDTMTGALNISNSTASTNTTTGALIVLGGVGISGALNATTKSFNIKHPTKKGKNLTYGSLEGPEFGVYVRGRTKENVIELPDYWVKLIDANTITVQLTPIGNYQTLFVEKIENNKVYIKNSNLMNRSIDCFYIIFAERADVDKLKVEN